MADIQTRTKMRIFEYSSRSLFAKAKPNGDVALLGALVAGVMPIMCVDTRVRVQALPFSDRAQVPVAVAYL